MFTTKIRFGLLLLILVGTLLLPVALESRGAEEQSNTQTTARTIAYTYDAAGRLVAADYGNGRRVTYAYDNAGNLLRREVAAGPVVQKVYLPLTLRLFSGSW